MRRRITVLAVAIGLTIWFDTISVLSLFVSRLAAPDAFELAAIFIMQTYYLLMLLRWALVLTLLIRAVRARPLRWLPRAPPVQVIVVGALQLLLGILSLIGFLALWVNTRTEEQVLGFVLHVVIPTIVVGWLARRQQQPIE
jgi:hypothetical protein